MLGKKVTRIISAKEVVIGQGKMWMSDICFDKGVGKISAGFTNVAFKYDSPRFFSVLDSGEFLPYNYFIGEVDVRWSPKVTNKIWDAHETISDSKAVCEQIIDGYTLYIPERLSIITVYRNAVKRKREIDEWITLWQLYEEEKYKVLLKKGSYVEAKMIADKADVIWKNLEKEGLIVDDMLLNPQQVFVLAQRSVKQECYNHAKDFGVEWITPNVCISEREESFFDLMSKYYEVNEILSRIL